MQTFTDNEKRVWEIKLSVTAVERVKAHTGINLYELVDDGFAGFGRLVLDPLSLCAVVYAICKPQADEKGITVEQFGEGMRGEAVLRATEALERDFADFYHVPLVGAGLRKLSDARGRLMREAEARGMAQLAAIDIDDLVRKSLEQSYEPPESSVSTPDPSPSAN